MKISKLLIVGFAIALSSCNHDNDESQNAQNNAFDNEIHMCSFDLLHLSEEPYSKPNAAIINWPRWVPGQTIKIKFLNGDLARQERVKEIAKEWMVYANLNFEYLPVTEYADIRIGFRWNNDSGSWSVLGRNSTSYSTNYQNEPSMNFGWYTLGNESTTRREALHEFGHALGLIHETTSPAADIPWNLPKVYKYYYDLMGYSKEQVDASVINKRSPDQTNYSAYDKLSIMHYYIDPSLTTNNVRIPESTGLSITDMIYINKWYPFPIRSTVQSEERIDKIPWTKSIKSPNGLYELRFKNGFLYVSEISSQKIIWLAGVSASDASAAIEQGNLVIKREIDRQYVISWRSGTTIYNGSCNLELQNNGNLILKHNETVVWSSQNALN